MLRNAVPTISENPSTNRVFNASMEVVGEGGKVLQAVGVAIPPPVREAELCGAKTLS